MLYPQKSIIFEEEDSETNEADNSDENEPQKQPGNNFIKKQLALAEETNADDEPVGLANQYLPSAMGFTIRMKSGEQDDQFHIDVRSAYYEKAQARYHKKEVNAQGNIENALNRKTEEEVTSEYWIRRPVNPARINLRLKDLKMNCMYHSQALFRKDNERDWLVLKIYDRTTQDDRVGGLRTLTIVIINNLQTNRAAESEDILFQNELELTTGNPDLISPYKERTTILDTYEEEEFNMLYRRKRIFAVGHGVSVCWDSEEDTAEEHVTAVYTTAIPEYEIPQIAPKSSGQLSMLTMSYQGNWGETVGIMESLAGEYEQWIEEIINLAANSAELENYRQPAARNVEKCRETLNRIRDGIELLKSQDEDSDIVRAFRWMNSAMLWQQQRSKTRLRKWNMIGNICSLEGINGSDNQNFDTLDEYHNQSGINGRWRPFQLAFILMNIRSITDPSSDERKITDLIWFPTGGGKTEAYLGLSALMILYRRLHGRGNPQSGGTAVLMRYTLRLLTTQQYERAASLICGCELIRRKNALLFGPEPITIGLWVGGSTTPNTNDEARKQYECLIYPSRHGCHHTEYNFVVMKCPCCGAQIGKIQGMPPRDRVKGLRREDGNNGSIIFRCDNQNCEFSNTDLPLHVVDEYIYNNPPTLLLGTVDKFAILTWKSEAGRLFGFRHENNEWIRIRPPELIIQDELHLISGPLGTVVGLYETMIQTLCNNYNRDHAPFITSNAEFTPPKIIASSATISRAYEQVKNLYAIEDRKHLNIFPPQGLEFGNTWFSVEKSPRNTHKNGSQIYPGRKYIGVLASGYPSAQTSIVRTYSAVLQKVKELSQNERIDYYWTLLGFFNSIRELGGAESLVYGDIRERLVQIQNRELAQHHEKRYINQVLELTSRISSSKIPETLKKLEESFTQNNNNALDICLATNMIATGVDVSRLGLMFVHGQPKTTAEYIQASSRVGRKLPDGPGLIVTLYSPTKPRDKSHYEHFQSYHSRIYSKVEPSSVTPWSANSRSRALHAVLIGLMRHFSAGALRDNPMVINEQNNKRLFEIFKSLIVKRCKVLESEESAQTEAMLDNIYQTWINLGPQRYGDAANYYLMKQPEETPLMYSTSKDVSPEIIRENKAFKTPSNMRGVDSETRLKIINS
ncbi:MAG: helicase-related protein [Candidatus Kapaibacterium sp.]